MPPDPVAELKRGELVGIFPEREITLTGQIQTFQRDIEGIIERSPGTPIIPVYPHGLWRHPLSAAGQRSLANWISNWGRKVIVAFGDPLYGPVSAAEVRQRVVELASEAIAFEKTTRATLGHRLLVVARRNWFRPCIGDSTGKQLSFGQTLTAAVLVRNWLKRNRPNEQNIGLIVPTSVAGAISNFGVTLAGKTVVNLNFTTGSSNLWSAVEQCRIRTILTSQPFLEKIGMNLSPEMVYIEELLSGFTRPARLGAMLIAFAASARLVVGSIWPDDIACIVFSSGSTGIPKGVQLSHWNLVTNVDALRNLLPVSLNDCMLGVLPLFHSFGYTFALWFPIIANFQAVFHAAPTDAKAIGELAQKYRPTFLLSTPTFCSQYIRKCTREQFSSLKYVVVGAEMLKQSIGEEFREKFGVALLAGYGCTEVGPGVAVNIPDIKHGDAIQPGSRAGSVGRPLPGVAVRVVDPETFEPLPPGKQGMLLVNGPSRMISYHNAPEKTMQVLRDGYYITGDLGYLDEDGFLYVIDRLARFSKIGGEMVPHLKIEDALRGVLGNTPYFVTGIPDERRGERIAVLYTSREVTPTALIERLNAIGFPPLWIPKRENFYLVDAIPSLASGKVDLAKARAIVLERAAQEGGPETSGPALERDSVGTFRTHPT